MKAKIKRVLLTGEAGLIATALEAISEEFGFRIINKEFKNDRNINHWHDKNNIPCNPFGKYYTYNKEVDITYRPQLEHIFKFYDFDMVVHTAAYVGTDKCDADQEAAREVNEVATKNLATLCERHNKLMVNFSTTATMDPNAYSINNPITPATRRKPQTFYGTTKLNGEIHVKKSGCRYINFLPIFLYGVAPHDTSSIWSRMFIHNLAQPFSLGNQYEVLLDPKINKQYTHVTNIAPYIWSIISKNKENDEVVLCGEEIMPIASYLETAEQAFNSIFNQSMRYTLKPAEDYCKEHVGSSKIMKMKAGEDFGVILDFKTGMQGALNILNQKIEAIHSKNRIM